MCLPQSARRYLAHRRADPATAVAVRNVVKIEAIQVPGHDAVRFDFDVHSGAQRVRKVKKL